MERLEAALRTNELYEYLLGREKYYFHPSLSDLPTDPVVAFHWIEQYYDRDPRILEMVKEALAKMSADPEFAWFSLYYLYTLMTFLRARNISMNLSALVSTIESNLLSHRAKLMTDRSYVGVRSENGLWGDVLRMVRMMRKEGVEFGLLGE